MSAENATSQLWHRRQRHAGAVAASAALTGLDPAFLRDASRISLAASPEVERLLESMEGRLRALPMALTESMERCVYSVRGPVVWSETITARANALGSEDVFVCRTTTRTFDAPPNRLLVKILFDVGLAAKALKGPVGGFLDRESATEVEEVAAKAKAVMQHGRLSAVSPHAPSHRELARMKSARGNGNLGDLFAAQARLVQPFDAEDILGLCDDETKRMHEVALQAFDLATDNLNLNGGIDFGDGAFFVGSLTFRHPDSEGVSAPGLAIDGETVPDWRVADNARMATLRWLQSSRKTDRDVSESSDREVSESSVGI